MRTVFFILRKEFIQLRRNRMMLPIIFIVPIVQLFILVNAATLEIKGISISICDYDMSSTSRQIISKFDGSPFFNIVKMRSSDKELRKDIDDDVAHLALIIPAHFEKDLIRYNKAQLQLSVNAINGIVAGIGSAYAQQILIFLNRGLGR